MIVQLANSFWTSGIFDDVNSAWTWGTTGEIFGEFLDWATGSPQPNPDSYTCVTFNIDANNPEEGTWKDQPGDVFGPSFVCEAKKDSMN